MLATDLLDRLSGRAMEPCRQAVGRFLLARRPLSRDDALAVSEVPEEHWPLVAKCIGYGEDEVRVNAVTRKSLASASILQLEPSDEERAHRALADCYSRMDGAASIDQTQGAATVAWLEKQHHLAFDSGAELSEALPCRLQAAHDDGRVSPQILDAGTRALRRGADVPSG